LGIKTRYHSCTYSVCKCQIQFPEIRWGQSVNSELKFEYLYKLKVEAGDAADNWSSGNVPGIGGPDVSTSTLSGPSCDLETERVSLTPQGEQLYWPFAPDGNADTAAVSGDGQIIVFLADAENILVGDWLEQPEIHIHSRQHGHSWPL